MSAFSDPEVARKILTTYNTFAVVGCSNRPDRPSYGVARFLRNQGYRVICINPNLDECFGDACYPDLRSLEEPVDVVDIFRRSEAVGPHVEEAIEVGAKAVWMQLGVINEPAAQMAADAGLDVVMDRCPAIDFPRLVGNR
jgi:predicted CoA-binding protein